MTTWIFWVVLICLVVVFGVVPQVAAWRRRRSSDDVPPVYGNGTDGDLYLSGDITLTRDMHFRDVKPRPNTAGGTIYANGYRIYVKGTLTLAEGRGVVQIRRGAAPVDDGDAA